MNDLIKTSDILNEVLRPHIDKLRLLRELIDTNSNNLEISEMPGEPKGAVMYGLSNILCETTKAFDKAYKKIDALRKTEA